MTASPPTPTADSSSPCSGAESSQGNREKDSLHILPLSIVPLETPSLSRARLLKDARLKCVIEMFHDKSTGSGRLYVNQLNQVFSWPNDPVHPDLAMISALAQLNSYDVFSLRIELRRLKIAIDNYSDLKLSDEKNRELMKYMSDFTRPLIQQIYGNTETQISDVNDLIAKFAKPDKEDAIKNLRLMADKLQIKMDEVPVFLEDYGDIFLSLAFFKDKLDQTVPSIIVLTQELSELKKQYQLRQDLPFLSTCDYVERSLNDIISSITGRFECFDRHSQNLWENITADRFRKVKELIVAHHTTVGGVLCGLKVKMDAWEEKFGNGQGGPMQRADFIMAEIKRGIDVIMRIEAEAPAISAL